MDCDWELSKENIQPRKEGRDVTKLVAGLNTSKDHGIERLKEQHEYELALQVEDKEDHLEPWHRYVIWTEQNFPAGSSSELKLILERCIRTFHKSEKYKIYKEDKRLVQIYLKYADILKDPSDVFDYMFDQQIGMSHAPFYESWAAVLEVSSNYKKADEIYQLGIARNAQPFNSLQRQYQQFLARLAAKVKEEVDENVAGAEDQRGSLAALKKTKHGKISHDRVKGKSAKVKCGLRTQAVASQVPGSSFTVFEDGRCSASSLPTEKGVWRSAPEHSKMVKENTQRPGKWTSAKIAGAAGSILPAPNFAIHEDAQLKVVSNETRKPVVLSERKPLSSRKVPKEEADGKPIQKVLETTSFEQVVRYRKDNVYCGGYEFSLEELRALNPKYAIGGFTNYFPCAMEETCVMSNSPPKEEIVQNIPLCQMAIETCPTEENDIHHAVVETASTESIPKEEPSKRQSVSRQRLHFSPIGCTEKNEEVLAKEMIPLSSKITQDQGIRMDNKKDLSVLEMPGYEPVADDDANDGEMKEFDASIAGRTQEQALFKEAKVLRNWDLTEIEGIHGETGTFYGPVESTGVYDLQALPRNTPVGDIRAPPFVQREHKDATPFEDEGLDNGNFSALLGDCVERQPAKVDIPRAMSCQNRQSEANRALAKELFNISSNESTLADVDNFITAGVDSEKTKTPRIPSDIENSSRGIQHPITNEFARPESKLTSCKVSLVPAADNEETHKIAKYSKRNVEFSIFEDGDSILSSKNVKKDAFTNVDSSSKCPNKLEFSIFEDRETMNPDHYLSQRRSHASLHNNTKQTPSVCGVSGLSVAASSEAKSITHSRLGGELLLENELPSRISKGPPSTTSSAESGMQGGDFSIFSDDCVDDVQASPSGKKIKCESPKRSKTASELGEVMGKDIDSIVQQVLTIQEKPVRSYMKRLPCKELTPLSKEKQARIDDHDDDNDDDDRRCDSLCMPTPLTKKANQEVFAMFNKTPECEKRDLTMDTTSEVTNRFEQLILGQKCVAPVSQAFQPKFEIFDDVNEDGKVESDKGEIQRQSIREGHQNSGLKKTNCDNSDMHNTPSFGNFSSSHNGIAASTFCCPTAPAFSAEIGELGCTIRNEKTEQMSFDKRHLSPIEELSAESKSSSCSSTGKASFGCSGTTSVSRSNAPNTAVSHPGEGVVCSREQTEGQNPPPAFDMSPVCNPSCYVKCSKHCTVTENLEDTAPKFSLQLTYDQIKEESVALSVDNARCVVEPASVNPTKEIMGIITAFDFESYPKLYIDSDNELNQRFVRNSQVTLGNDVFIINKKLASGGFSVVYASSNCKDKNQVVLKVMESCEFCQWEFYIAEELHGRIDENGLDTSTHEDYIQPISGYIYSNGAVIQYPFYSGGTLLDLTNSFFAKQSLLKDVFALFYGLNVCRIIKTLHDLSIIHGDVKPDNFLIKPINSELMDGCIPNCLTLTDFGKCIDLKMFPEDITFKGRNNTDKFECVEMQKDKPWKYQVDYYGIACTLFVAYHGTYMECFQVNGKYKPTKTFRRPERDFWLSIMDRLINVGDCNDTTVLDTVIEDLETNLAMPQNWDNLKKLLTLHSQFASQCNRKSAPP